MKNNKIFLLGRCIAVFVIGYVLTLTILCNYFFEIEGKPENVPEGSVHVGEYESSWIYEVDRNDSIIHLLIYYPNGNLALDADFEKKGIDNVNSISSFDYVDRIIYLGDTLICHMVKSYGGRLHKDSFSVDSLSH